MCVCVCVFTTAEADPSGSICYRYEGVGDQSAGRIQEGGAAIGLRRAFVSARVCPDPLTDQRGSIDLWGNRRLSTGYSLYMGLGDLFIEIPI